jgi:hypothetical protein
MDRLYAAALGQKQRLVIGSAIPNVIPRALQHRCEGTLLIVGRHSRGIMTQTREIARVGWAMCWNATSFAPS